MKFGPEDKVRYTPSGEEGVVIREARNCKLPAVMVQFGEEEKPRLIYCSQLEKV